MASSVEKDSQFPIPVMYLIISKTPIDETKELRGPNEGA